MDVRDGCRDDTERDSFERERRIDGALRRLSL